MFSPVSLASCSRMCLVGFGVAVNADLSVSNCFAFIVVLGPRLLAPTPPPLPKFAFPPADPSFCSFSFSMLLLLSAELSRLKLDPTLSQSDSSFASSPNSTSFGLPGKFPSESKANKPIIYYTCIRSYRSATQVQLLVPRFRKEHSGRRGFSISSPQLWNLLPTDIRLLYKEPQLFRRRLKTHFMQQSISHHWGSMSPVRHLLLLLLSKELHK